MSHLLRAAIARTLATKFMNNPGWKKQMRRILLDSRWLDSPSHSTEYDERNLFRWLLAGRPAVYTRRKILYAKIPAV
jgi:hypothetical protein